MRKRFWSATIAVLALALSARGAFADAALDSLVSSERAFSAMSAAQGMKAAFLEFLGEDAIVFAPTPTNGRQVWQARQPSKATLVWEPEFAEVSSSGDLGYTTGTNSFTFPDAQGRLTTSNGRYVTVWRNEPGGRWRCVVDFWNEAPPAPGIASPR